MLEYFIVVFLALIFVGVLFLIGRAYTNQVSEYQGEHNQEILEKLQELNLEIAELKLSMESFSLLFKRKSEQWDAERRALESSIKKAIPAKNQPILFLNDRYKEIFVLHEQGVSPEQIAKKLDKGLGEVAFILQLANQDTPMKGVK